MEFNNDTIFDIMECWNVGMLDLSVLGFSVRRYCGMLNKQIYPNKIYTLTDELPMERSVSCGSAYTNGFFDGFDHQYVSKDISIGNN